MINIKLQFESNNFVSQDASTLFEDIQALAKQIENIIRLPVKVKALKSRRDKTKTHFIMECESDNIDILLAHVDGRFDIFKTMGIEELHLWFYYGYIGQCNMEFNNEQLSIMARNNIKLLISCWSEDQAFDDDYYKH